MSFLASLLGPNFVDPKLIPGLRIFEALRLYFSFAPTTVNCSTFCGVLQFFPQMRLSNVLLSPNSREVLEWSAADAVRPFLWRRWRQTKLTIIPRISPPFKIQFISCDRSFYVPSEKEYGKFKNSKLYLVFWRHWISWICPSFLYFLVPFFSSIRKINSLFELIAWKRSLPTHHLGRKKKN